MPYRVHRSAIARKAKKAGARDVGDGKSKCLNHEDTTGRTRETTKTNRLIRSLSHLRPWSEIGIAPSHHHRNYTGTKQSSIGSTILQSRR